MALGGVGYTLPLSREQFEHAVQAGLGRAVLHLRKVGIVGLEDVILAACGKHPAYDAQCEYDRTPWISALVIEAGLEAAAAERVAQAIAQNTYTYDLSHAAGIAAALAERGSELARASLYRVFDRRATEDDWIGVEEIIGLDGLSGLLYIARELGARLRADPSASVDITVKASADRHIGREEAESVLRQASERDADIGAFVAAVYGLLDDQRVASCTTNMNAVPALVAPTSDE